MSKSENKKGGIGRVFKLGCLGLIGVFVVFGVLGVIVSSGGDTTTATVASEQPQASIAAVEPVEEEAAQAEPIEPQASAAPEPTAVPEPIAEPSAAPLPVINMDVFVDKVRWNVLSAEDIGDTIQSDNEFIESKHTSARFIKVRYDVENQDTEMRTTTGLNLVDDQGREFIPYTDAFWAIPDGESGSFENLNPNIQKTVTVFYEVPKDATGLKLVVSDLKMFGGEEQPIVLGIDAAQ